MFPPLSGLRQNVFTISILEKSCRLGRLNSTFHVNTRIARKCHLQIRAFYIVIWDLLIYTVSKPESSTCKKLDEHQYNLYKTLLLSFFCIYCSMKNSMEEMVNWESVPIQKSLAKVLDHLEDTDNRLKAIEESLTAGRESEAPKITGSYDKISQHKNVLLSTDRPRLPQGLTFFAKVFFSICFVLTVFAFWLLFFSNSKH